MRKGWAAVWAAGTVLAVAGSAWALAASGIVGADGTINGCYAKQNGQLRVVPPGAECRPSEEPLQWSQQGPQGVAVVGLGVGQAEKLLPQHVEVVGHDEGDGETAQPIT